jgi:hypothetical protein
MRTRALSPNVCLRDDVQFVRCEPSSACAGGVESSVALSDPRAGCSRNYQGPRCSACTVGAYRRRAKCTTCPNTAWLLFLGFALMIIGAVAAAVYLSKKRINMAGLSVGVVRGWQGITLTCLLPFSVNRPPGLWRVTGTLPCCRLMPQALRACGYGAV